MFREDFVKIIESLAVGNVLLLANRGLDNVQKFRLTRIKYYDNPRFSTYKEIQFMEFEVTLSTGKIMHDKLTVWQIVDNYDYVGLERS